MKITSARYKESITLNNNVFSSFRPTEQTGEFLQEINCLKINDNKSKESVFVPLSNVLHFSIETIEKPSKK